MIICISGKKRTGKDTVSNYLSAYGYQTIAFADDIKIALAEAFKKAKIDEITGLDISLNDFYYNGIGSDCRENDLSISNASAKLWLKTAVEILNDVMSTDVPDDVYIESKKVWSLRILMQTLGTDIVTQYSPNYWIKRTINKILDSNENNFIITDVRFDNEAQALRKFGGKVIFIYRDTGLVDNHASEQGLTPLPGDLIINNNSTLENLFKQVDKIYE